MLKFMVPIMFTMIMKTKNTKVYISMLIITFNASLQTTPVQKMSYLFMGDQVSFWSTNLALWITYIVIFMKASNHLLHSKIMTFLLLIFVMIFYVWNLMIFYMIFEASMIIMLMIMISWSYQPERTEAMIFLIIMTMLFSLPFLTTILTNTKTLNFWFMSMNMNNWNYISLLFIFMMKMPFYFIHFWLPKVHVEAPIQGSMILAAIMLKLGCYGMIRIMPMIKSFKSINSNIIAIAMWGMILLSISCFIQADIKTMIAYSSVVHMMVVLMIILINKKKSITSSMITIISHGLCASALFFLSNMFYKNSKSRSIMMNKGSLTTMPSTSLMWFSACMTNVPMPPAISMVSEVMAMKLIMSWSNMMSTVFMIMLFGSLYSIIMFYTAAHGKFSKMTKLMAHIPIKPKLMLMLHMIPVILLSVKVKMLLIS